VGAEWLLWFGFKERGSSGEGEEMVEPRMVSGGWQLWERKNGQPKGAAALALERK